MNSLSWFEQLFAGLSSTYRSRLRRVRMVGAFAGSPMTATGVSLGDKFVSLEIIPMPILLSERITTGAAGGTSSTNEVVIDTVTLAAGRLGVGKKYRLSGVVRFPATHTTDTATIRIRMGEVTLTGNIIGTAAARDVANNDIVAYELEITPRSATNAEVSGWVTASAASGAAAPLAVFKDVTYATNATNPIFLEVTVQFSVSDAGNSAVSERFSLEVYPPNTTTTISEDEVTFGANTVTLSTTSVADSHLELLFVDRTP